MDTNLATQLWRSGFDGLAPWISSLEEDAGKSIVQASSLESYASMLVCFWRDNQAATNEHWSLFFANFYSELSETLNLMVVPCNYQLSSKLAVALRRFFRRKCENQKSPQPNFASVMIELLVGFMLLRQSLETMAIGENESFPFRLMSDQAGVGFVDHCCALIPLQIPLIDGVSIVEAINSSCQSATRCLENP